MHRSGVLKALAWLVPHETAAISVQVLCTPYNHALCHFMQRATYLRLLLSQFLHDIVIARFPPSFSSLMWSAWSPTTVAEVAILILMPFNLICPHAEMNRQEDDVWRYWKEQAKGALAFRSTTEACLIYSDMLILIQLKRKPYQRQAPVSQVIFFFMSLYFERLSFVKGYHCTAASVVVWRWPPFVQNCWLCRDHHVVCVLIW